METEREVQLKQIIRCFDFWMKLKENNINFVQAFFYGGSIENIGIYGFGKLGRHLVGEIKEAGFNVTWVADRKADIMRVDRSESSGVKLISPAEITEACDYVIVTTAGNMESIEKEISERVNTRIIHLEEILITTLKSRKMI